MLATETHSANLTDRDFLIGYEPAAPGSTHGELRGCPICEGSFFPPPGYQLYVVMDAAPVWCCGNCVLAIAPRLTGLLREGWRLQEQDAVRA